MICPACRAKNPDGAVACLTCKSELPQPPKNISPEMEGMQTIAPPSNFQEWARGSGAAASAVSVVLPEGVEIGHRYQVLKLLGVGGMGTVYRVHDKELDRDVALKLIRPEIASSAENLD